MSGPNMDILPVNEAPDSTMGRTAPVLAERLVTTPFSGRLRPLEQRAFGRDIPQRGAHDLPDWDYARDDPLIDARTRRWQEAIRHSKDQPSRAGCCSSSS